MNKPSVSKPFLSELAMFMTLSGPYAQGEDTTQGQKYAKAQEKLAKAVFEKCWKPNTGASTAACPKYCRDAIQDPGKDGKPNYLGILAQNAVALSNVWSSGKDGSGAGGVGLNLATIGDPKTLSNTVKQIMNLANDMSVFCTKEPCKAGETPGACVPICGKNGFNGMRSRFDCVKPPPPSN